MAEVPYVPPSPKIFPSAAVLKKSLSDGEFTETEQNGNVRLYIAFSFSPLMYTGISNVFCY